MSLTTREKSNFPIAQYLQNAILKLCNDQISYTETLQVLGVLCITVDGEQTEVVVKINSTLKRLNSLTPPKENSPCFIPKSSTLLNKSLLTLDSSNSNDVNVNGVLKKKDTFNEKILLNNNSGVSCKNFKINTKSRGRKQLKPAKLSNPKSQINDECQDLNCRSQDIDVDDFDALPDDNDCGLNNKNHYISPSVNPSLPLNYNNAIDCLNIKDEKIYAEDDSDENGCLDLSNKTIDKNEDLDPGDAFGSLKLNCSDKIWNFGYPSIPPYISNFNLPLLQMNLSKNISSNDFINHSLNNGFNVRINNCNNTCFNTMATSSSSPQNISFFRKILPATTPCKEDKKKSDLNQQQLQQQQQQFSDNNLRSNKDTSNGQEIKMEEDFLLDCLNVNGKKRRRRSLEDALTLDEIHEYIGSREKPMEDTYNCKLCPSTSTDLLKYFHHTLSVHNSFVCHQCGRCFTTKSSLLRHRPIHTGLRRFACGICQKAFYRKDKCKAHIRKHAEVYVDSEASSNIQVL